MSSASKRNVAAGGRGRKRAAHLGPERRRPLVLDAAFDVFLERGYDETSMESIARRAGVTKPVVYACYPGKDELFAALFEREEARILGQVAAALPAEVGDDIEGAVAEGLTAFLRGVADSPRAFRVLYLGEGGYAAPVVERLDQGRAAAVEMVALLVGEWLERRGQGDAEARARLSAYALVGAAESAARGLLAEPDRFTPESVASTLARLLVRGALSF